MNKRIRELVRQAVESVDIVTGNESLDDELAKMYIPDCFAEKFAELIVQECAMKANAVAIDLRNDRDLDARKYVGNSILKALGS
jgi:hypothetical protein